MKVLLTTHHLLDFAGSELFTLTLADYLTRRGVQVTVYSRYVDRLDKYFKKLKIPVVTDLREIKRDNFDLAHVHHNVNAVEVRHYFPDLPIVFMAHGVLPLLEQPPVLDLKISAYLAISSEIKDHLIANGVPKDKITIIPNLFDPKIFYPRRPIHQVPRSVLVISSQIDEHRENIIRSVCQKLNLKVNFIGGRFNWIPYDKVPGEINQADIVFSLGRGVIETMLCRRIPFIYDYQGGDGIVTPHNYNLLSTHNFSGRTLHLEYTVKQIESEIYRNYSQTNAQKIYHLAETQFKGETQIGKFLQVYRRVKKEKVIPIDLKTAKVVSRMVKQYEEIRWFSAYKSARNFQNQINLLQSQLNRIQSSKVYRIWQGYNRWKHRLIDFLQIFHRLIKENNNLV